MNDRVVQESRTDELLQSARRATSRRAAHTVHGGRGHVMRQTMLALAAGASLAEHESPGEATLYVIEGRVEVRGGPTTWDAHRGDIVDIPNVTHSLTAVEDSVVLLSIVPREYAETEGARGSHDEVAVSAPDAAGMSDNDRATAINPGPSGVLSAHESARESAVAHITSPGPKFANRPTSATAPASSVKPAEDLSPEPADLQPPA